MKWLLISISFGISFVIIIGHYLPRLDQLQLTTIGIGSVPYIVFYLLQSLAFAISVPSVQKQDGIMISNVGYVINITIPFQAGEALKVVFLKAFDVSLIKATKIVVILRILDLLVILTALVISILIFYSLTLVLIFYILLGLVILFRFRLIDYSVLILHRIVSYLPGVDLLKLNFLKNPLSVVEDSKNLFSSRILLLKVLAWSANFLGFWLNFGVNFGSFEFNLLVFCMLTLGLTVIVTPLGVGQVQLTFQGLMALLGHDVLPESMVLDLISWQMSYVVGLICITSISLGLRLIPRFLKD